MDSGNSDSLQSTSGDEEYDSPPAAAVASEPDSLSALMNNNSNKRIRTNFDGIQQTNPSQINVTNFDTFSNYFDGISRQPPPPPPPLGSHHHTQNSILNLDTMSSSWLKALRSDLISSAENIHHQHNNQAAVMSSANTQPCSNSFTTTTVNLPAGTENINPTQVVRNPKKRTRASRRAPTTVLATDTTNFRAMVQEFTGIPAPPFTSSSSPFSRTSTRFDLFGSLTASNLRSSIPLDSSQTPSYLRRPFPQKVQLQPPVSPPSLPFLASTSSASSSSPLLNSTSTVDLDHTNNFNNLSNHLLLSSSLLQQKFPPPSSLKAGGMNILDQFGQFNNTGSLRGLPGLISSDQTTPASRNNNDSTNPMNWDGNANGNLNISNNFHGEKGIISTDNVAAGGASRGGERMMESWVCSSGLQ